MVKVVRRNAGNQREIADLAPARRLREIGRREPGDGGAQLSMGALEQRDVVTPDAIAESLAAIEPVRPLQRKRPAWRVGEPAVGGVLPVGGVDDEFPDVVPLWRGPPR